MLASHQVVDIVMLFSDAIFTLSSLSLLSGLFRYFRYFTKGPYAISNIIYKPAGFH